MATAAGRNTSIRLLREHGPAMLMPDLLAVAGGDADGRI
jgi:hypothetical protein